MDNHHQKFSPLIIYPVSELWVPIVWTLPFSAIGYFERHLIKIQYSHVEAGLIKSSHNMAEIGAGFVFEKDGFLTEIEAGFVQGIIYKCMLY